jgi:hypothetical protein
MTASPASRQQDQPQPAGGFCELTAEPQSSSDSKSMLQQQPACSSTWVSTASSRIPIIAAAAMLPVATEAVSSPAAATTPAATAPALSSAGPAVSAVRVGYRLARESVGDELPGLLEGCRFGPWLPVEPHRLRRLKQAVPRKPGLYEVRQGPGSCQLSVCLHARHLLACRIALMQSSCVIECALC